MIEVKNLVKNFAVKETVFGSLINSFKKRKKYVRAVNNISFTMQPNEVMGLAGESGCGKTTTAMLLLNLYSPTQGEILFEGKNIATLKGIHLTSFRRKAQMIFQDPYESLNPRFTVSSTIEEPLIIHKVHSKNQRLEKIKKAMERSRLTPIEAFLNKFPHELSGGERQRVCIARAIVLEPVLLIADEAVSMLDVSIRASILNILRKLTEDMNMATLYISHDLSLLGNICDKLAIMYAGEIVELGTPEQIIGFPLHPYTQALITAVPKPEFTAEPLPLADTIAGEPPNLIDLYEGCSFQPRCKSAVEKCKREKPKLCENKQGHSVSCFVKGELLCKENMQ